jgi:hypothetical protein
MRHAATECRPGIWGYDMIWPLPILADPSYWPSVQLQLHYCITFHMFSPSPHHPQFHSHRPCPGQKCYETSRPKWGPGPLKRSSVVHGPGHWSMVARCRTMSHGLCLFHSLIGLIIEAATHPFTLPRFAVANSCKKSRREASEDTTDTAVIIWYNLVQPNLKWVKHVISWSNAL